MSHPAPLNPSAIRRDDRPVKFNESGKYDKIPKDLQEEAIEAPPTPLASCASCGRKFAANRLARHEEVCKEAKSNSQRRGVFSKSH